MNPKSSLAVLLCLVAVSGSVLAADCRFQNQNQQQQCLRQEQARQQAEAQQRQQLQQQLQQQQAQQRAQEQQRQQEQARRAQEQQRQQEQAHQAELERQRQAELARKQQETARLEAEKKAQAEKARLAEQEERAHQAALERQRQAEAARKQQEQAHQAELERQRQAELARKQQEQAHQAELERQRQAELARKQQETARLEAEKKAQAEKARLAEQQREALTRQQQIQQRPICGYGQIQDGNGCRTPATQQTGTPISPTQVPAHASSQIAPVTAAKPAATTPTVSTGSAPSHKEVAVQQVNPNTARLPNAPAPAFQAAHPPALPGQGNSVGTNLGASNKSAVNPLPNQTANSTASTLQVTPAPAPVRDNIQTVQPIVTAPTASTGLAPVQEVGIRRANTGVPASSATASALTVAPNPTFSSKELARINALTKEQQDQLKRLSPETVTRMRASGQLEQTLKAHEESNVPFVSRYVQELPRQAASVTTGAVVGVGQAAVETAKGAYGVGQRIGTPIGNAIGNAAGEVIYNPQAVPSEIRGAIAKAPGEIRDSGTRVVQGAQVIANDPLKVVGQAGSAAGNIISQAGQAAKSTATDYADAIKRGDGYEAGRVIGKTTAATAVVLDTGGTGAATQAERFAVQETKRITTLGVEQQTGRQIVAEKLPQSSIGTTAKVQVDPRGNSVTRLEPNNPQSTSLPRQGNRLVLNQGDLPTCGATSCAMVLNTAGKKVDVQKLILDSNTKLGGSGPQGATIHNLATALQENGIPGARVEEGLSMEQLAEATSKGKPAIAAMLVNRGSGQAGHAVVVDGVTIRDGIEVVAVRDPALGRQYFTPVQEFKSKWNNGRAILTNY